MGGSFLCDNSSLCRVDTKRASTIRAYAFLMNPGPPFQRQHHPQWALSPLITNCENAPQLDLMEALSQLKLLSLS